MQALKCPLDICLLQFLQERGISPSFALRYAASCGVLDPKGINLSRYYFVTADLTQNLGGNYIIYGHCSDTYGHSFNRLEELNIGDTFYILQENMKYDYRVEAVDRVLRSESNPYFPALKNRVTFVSCEKNIAAGYTENRVIIVRSVQTNKEVIR